MNCREIGPEAAARKDMWAARGRATVTHPKYGRVVVPHASNLAAIKCAAEYWGVHWTELRKAEVWAARPEDGRCVGPRDYVEEAIRALKKKSAGPVERDGAGESSQEGGLPGKSIAQFRGQNNA